MKEIHAKNIRLQYGQNEILKGLDLDINAGEFIALIGPNGAGKSSLMRAVMGFDKHAQGDCNLWTLSTKERAKCVAWLSQEREVNWDLPVKDVIAMGRMAWRKGFSDHLSSDDQKLIKDAAEKTQVNAFLDRHYFELSGGERARVQIARLLAQNTPFILADEPIHALDPAQQIHIMSQFQSLAKAGKSILISIHDLGLAARYCSKLILLDHGQKRAEGPYDEVLTDENLAKVFHVNAFRGEQNGPIIQPIGIEAKGNRDVANS